MIEPRWRKQRRSEPETSGPLEAVTLPADAEPSHRPAVEIGLTTPVRHQRLSDQVYESLFREIAMGRLQSGTRLPTEVELSKLFHVSRPVVRDALSLLRADGLISSRQGSGSFVEKRPDHDFLSFAPEGSIAEILRCFEFRIGLEGDAAYFAAKRRTTANLAMIKRAVDKLSEAITTKQVGSEADVEFHLGVAQASGNYLYVQTLSDLRRQMEAGMQLARNITLLRGHARIDLVFDEHVAILEAVELGDADRSRSAMHTHIENARQRILTAAPTPYE